MAKEPNIGTIVQVIGPTVDVEFPPEKLPPILNAIRIRDEERGIDITGEVSLHVGDSAVRCIAMSSTDGLVRGMPVSCPSAGAAAISASRRDSAANWASRSERSRASVSRRRCSFQLVKRMKAPTTATRRTSHLMRLFTG